MKIRNRAENIRYLASLAEADNAISQAIDCLTYTAYPELNKRLIEKLEDALETVHKATRAVVYKP